MEDTYSSPILQIEAVFVCSCQEEELNVNTLEPSRFTASIEDNCVTPADCVADPY